MLQEKRRGNTRFRALSRLRLRFTVAFGYLEFLRVADAVIVLNLQTEQFFFHFASDFLHAGTAVEVVHLGGVGLEVVEFPRVDVVVEVDEFVTLIAHTVVTRTLCSAGYS